MNLRSFISLVIGGMLLGSFTFTGSMNSPRAGQTSTSLTDGSILVAGGYDTSTGLSSAEIYAPTANLFILTGSMTTPRYYDTATLLNNGMVLIVGGTDNELGMAGILSSAELYNPTTGEFNPTGSLHYARYAHTATLLGDGTVLIIGGYGPSNLTVAPTSPLPYVEIYNPASGDFTLTADLNTARYLHTATLLGNGSVLVAGGYGGSAEEGFGYLASAEIYNFVNPPVARPFDFP